MDSWIQGDDFMKIAMAGNHAGFNLKKEIKELLESQGYSDCRKAY